MPEFNITFFIIGCIGGLLPELLRLIKGKFSKTVLKKFKAVKTWVFMLLMALLGGFVVWLLNIKEATGAVAYGFSAPQIIESLASKKTDTEKRDQPSGEKRLARAAAGGTTEAVPIEAEKEEFSIRSWWAY